MKTNYLIIFSVLFGVISCKQIEKNPETVIEKSDCYPNDDKPSQIITYEEMAAMMEAFEMGPKKELNNYLKKVTNGKDSVSTVYNWYKLDDLKQYIAYIERISKEKNIKVTGFRIYPSTYPNDYKEKELRNLQTLFFVPTTKVNGNDDVAFEPLYSKIGEPAEITQFLEKVRTKKPRKTNLISEKSQDDLESSSANRLKPTPPPY